MYSYLSYNPDTHYIIKGTGSLLLTILFIYTYIFIDKYQLYTTNIWLRQNTN
jgi:hypothetical protein